MTEQKFPPDDNGEGEVVRFVIESPVPLHAAWPVGTLDAAEIDDQPDRGGLPPDPPATPDS